MSRIKYSNLLIKYNNILSNNGNFIQIRHITPKVINLSNDTVLTGDDRRKFISKIKSKIFASSIDALYDNTKSKNEIDVLIRNIITQTAKISSQKADKTNFLKYVKTKGRGSHLKGKKYESGEFNAWCKGKTKYTDNRLKIMSENMLGNKNPSVRLHDEIFTDAYRKRHSCIMKQKILSGEFTPNVKNSLTTKKYFYDKYNFRSSWEAIFFANNKDLNYEIIRIPYYDSNKHDDRIYIVDFVDNINKILYEIKPLTLIENKFKDKHNAAMIYAVNHNYKFVIISENDIIKLSKNISDLEIFKFDKFTQKTILKFKQK